MQVWNTFYTFVSYYINKAQYSMKGQEKEEQKIRIDKMRPLPPHWKKEFAKSYPEYNTIEGGNKLSSIVRGFTIDFETVGKMEKLFGKKSLPKQPKKREAVK